MKKPYIFFDFDGTVINTNEIIIDSWNATALKYLGHTLETDAILKTFGETIRYTSSVWFPEVPVDEAVAYYRDYQNAHCEGKVRLFEGMPELIGELREKGYKVCLVTSRTKATSMAYLAEFGMTDKFDVIITCDDTTVHKPDPEPLNMAIRYLASDIGKGIEPSECIMIGDTKFDIGCGNNAGVDTVIVEWAHPIDMEGMEAFGAKPTYTISSPQDLWELV